MLFTQAVYYGIQHPGVKLGVSGPPFRQAARALDAARRQLQTVSLPRTLHHLHVRPPAPPYLANRKAIDSDVGRRDSSFNSTEILLFQAGKKNNTPLQAVGIVAPADE